MKWKELTDPMNHVKKGVSDTWEWIKDRVFGLITIGVSSYAARSALIISFLLMYFLVGGFLTWRANPELFSRESPQFWKILKKATSWPFWAGKGD